MADDDIVNMSFVKFGEGTNTMFIRRVCDKCGKILNYTDERYELKHITFHRVKGSQTHIVGKFCPECHRKLKMIDEV